MAAVVAVVAGVCSVFSVVGCDRETGYHTEVCCIVHTSNVSLFQTSIEPASWACVSDISLKTTSIAAKAGLAREVHC